ncbi:MAG TPA: TonB-dependent receptor [Cytophagaceae bacterium]|nr:TonB-dependent receptor [Cytophagaceae bacterium]
MAFIILFLLSIYGSRAQECHFTIHGKVSDSTGKNPLPYATLRINELNRVLMADSLGKFSFQNVCAGIYTIECALLGHKKKTEQITLQGNLFHQIYLKEETNTLQEVVVVSKNKNEQVLQTLPIASISKEDLLRTRGSTLGEALKTIPGLNSLQTGPSVSKPMIHGLHSNRILILNNEVRQEAQQWGSEHAPEIDPFIANRISVIRGAASIRYGSDAIAGVILVEPKMLPIKPGVYGELNLVGMSNSRLGASSAMLEGACSKKLQGLSWRLQGTLRRAGNSKTAHYYMENTALEEVNFSSAVSYTRKRLSAEIYASQFYTKLGIFTGSQVGNLVDLQMALQSAVPITPSFFSYKIGRPYQQVTHDLIKAKTIYRVRSHSKIELVYAWQQNKRYEYDYIPLNGSLDPALFLQIATSTADATWHHQLSKNISGLAGMNGITQGNIREYQFLIPNFRNYGAGVFLIEKWKKDRLTIEGGFRYDYRWLRAYMIDNNTAKLVTPTRTFSNTTATFGMGYSLKNNLIFSTNIGTAWRAPSVNELYSYGVHQSAASYDIGNPNLQSERAYNFVSTLNYSGKRLFGEIGFYNNQINNYIYSKPDLQLIYTVRGAFPEFTYTQVNARFRGLDIKASYVLRDSLTFTTKASLLWAYNQTIHNYLIFVPSNRYENSIRYSAGNIGKIRALYIILTNIYVSHQWRVPPNSDYTNPPPAYTLFNADLGFSLPIGKESININFSATNLLNAGYRDYLNRYRYFTNDVGRNFSIRLQIPFTVISKTNK